MGKRIAQIFTQSGSQDFSTRKTYPCEERERERERGEKEEGN